MNNQLSTNKRLFIAIELPDHIKKMIANIQWQLERQNYAQLRVTAFNSLHITIQFLGMVDEQQQSIVVNKLSAVTLNQFELCTGNLEFIKKHKSGLVWINLKSDDLQNLAHRIGETLADLIKPEERPFRGHVTIARIQKINNAYEFSRFLETISIESVCFPVTEFVLKGSILSDQGPEYFDIMKFRLE